MLHHPVTVAADDSVAEALRKMTDAGATELPVTDRQGRVIGDLTIIDVLYHALVPDGRTRPA